MKQWVETTLWFYSKCWEIFAFHRRYSYISTPNQQIKKTVSQRKSQQKDPRSDETVLDIFAHRPFNTNNDKRKWKKAARKVGILLIIICCEHNDEQSKKRIGELNSTGGTKKKLERKVTHKTIAKNKVKLWKNGLILNSSAHSLAIKGFFFSRSVRAMYGYKGANMMAPKTIMLCCNGTNQRKKALRFFLYSAFFPLLVLLLFLLLYLVKMLICMRLGWSTSSSKSTATSLHIRSTHLYRL